MPSRLRAAPGGPFRCSFRPSTSGCAGRLWLPGSKELVGLQEAKAKPRWPHFAAFRRFSLRFVAFRGRNGSERAQIGVERPRYAALDVGDKLQELWELDPGHLFWEARKMS